MLCVWKAVSWYAIAIAIKCWYHDVKIRLFYLIFAMFLLQIAVGRKEEKESGGVISTLVLSSAKREKKQ